ncbi:hypothetical protein Pcinc_000299 [Petrolisthes cinctipes]|uniref:Uncharacterized protein n=1 Tax=Petrolisthes cinctipes TaxID=88211 RepID=A0AAE1GS91_PETCI|nr:hypothetical protein Pcinc_000299 [Petrolisthes cinctipes]
MMAKQSVTSRHVTSGVNQTAEPLKLTHRTPGVRSNPVALTTVNHITSLIIPTSLILQLFQGLPHLSCTLPHLPSPHHALATGTPFTFVIPFTTPLASSTPLIPTIPFTSATNLPQHQPPLPHHSPRPPMHHHSHFPHHSLPLPPLHRNTHCLLLPPSPTPLTAASLPLQHHSLMPPASSSCTTPLTTVSHPTPYQSSPLPEWMVGDWVSGERLYSPLRLSRV